MRVSTPARCLIVTAAVVAVTALNAPAASAHSILGPPVPEAAHYLTQITGISPATTGISASVDPHGDWIQVTDTGASAVTILGYGREPYLRVDAGGGVEQNIYSPAVYLNQSLFTDLSQATQENRPPLWQPVSTGNSARWHDHRIHWMGASRAPAVAAHPGTRQVIGQWTVRLLAGATPVSITDTLSWLPLTNRYALTTVKKIALGVPCLVFAVALGAAWWAIRSGRGGGTSHSGPDEDDASRRRVTTTPW